MVKDIQGKLLDFKIFDTGCQEIYSDFTYSVNITLVNETSILRAGALLVKFFHPAAVKGAEAETARRARAEELDIHEEEVVLTEEVGTGGQIITFTRPPVATKFVFVEVPAGTTKTIEEAVQFRGFGLEEISGFGTEGVTHVLTVAPPSESITCPYSHGTGKVPFTEWLRLKAGV